MLSMLSALEKSIQCALVSWAALSGSGDLYGMQGNTEMSSTMSHLLANRKTFSGVYRAVQRHRWAHYTKDLICGGFIMP